MSSDLEIKEGIGPHTPGAQQVRRLSVYFSSGEGHAFELYEGDQLIDPLIKPLDAGDDWMPHPIDLEVPKLYIIRALKQADAAQQESIFLKHVAWMRWTDYWVAPKEQPRPQPQEVRRPGPAFRDDRRPQLNRNPPPPSKDNAKV